MSPNDQITIDPPPGQGELEGPRRIRRSVVASDEHVVKSGSGRERARLRHEADLLARLAGARVVDVVEVREHDDLTELVLADAGRRSLADLDLGTPDLTLRALQRLAEAVAELHELGWCHGAICAEHAVVNPRGNVRVCSLGSARPAGASPGDVDEDLSALLSVVEHVARRPVGRRCGPRERWDHAAVRRRLGRLVERCRRHLDRGELSGASIADELRALRRGMVGREHGAAAMRPRATIALCAAAALVAVGGLTAAARSSDGTADASPPDVEPPAGPSTSTAAAPDPTSPPSTVTGSTIVVPPGAPAGSCAGPVVDIDGDGCDDEVMVDGEIVEVGGARYALGIPGDTAAVGDWDCDGIATARLLRATSGAVYEFDTWATSDTDTVGRLVGVVDGAIGIVRGDDPTEIGCDVLHVVAADGSEEEL